jgi:hypothetical protein
MRQGSRVRYPGAIVTRYIATAQAYPATDAPDERLRPWYSAPRLGFRQRFVHALK